MRSAPQVLFSLTILKISSRTSLLTHFLPERFRFRESHFQYSLNPDLCQRTTVSGWIRIKAFRQSVQRRRKTIQNNLSGAENRDWGRRRAKKASRCRMARRSEEHTSELQ